MFNSLLLNFSVSVFSFGLFNEPSLLSAPFSAVPSHCALLLSKLGPES